MDVDGTGRLLWALSLRLAGRKLPDLEVPRLSVGGLLSSHADQPLPWLAQLDVDRKTGAVLKTVTQAEESRIRNPALLGLDGDRITTPIVLEIPELKPKHSENFAEPG